MYVKLSSRDTSVYNLRGIFQFSYCTTSDMMQIEQALYKITFRRVGYNLPRIEYRLTIYIPSFDEMIIIQRVYLIIQLVTLQSTENPLEFAIVNPRVTQPHTAHTETNTFYVQILHGMYRSQEIPPCSKPCMTAHEERSSR